MGHAIDDLDRGLIVDRVVLDRLAKELEQGGSNARVRNTGRCQKQFQITDSMDWSRKG